ncbi:hypothetical protein VFPPC_11539 [Pochonia chlamydosporia 170]|uniref:Uncharacterized protein n=1 Tax=Pochonia chlamydosporia 170 TaxID=1380566 RepID=A0A179EZT9_METCM|nr:hypothetical protein VFPPC_11539 [Pochonia chlamydosporia 170]OAQ58419.2 hypothetical protein VFPPC_11539 [Pochonia chlamydosporia 170]
MHVAKTVIALWALSSIAAESVSAMHGSSVNKDSTQCLSECAAAQREFANLRGARLFLCSCGSPFLKKADDCAACLIYHDVWKYLTPWIALISYCNPRRDECVV